MTLVDVDEEVEKVSHDVVTVVAEPENLDVERNNATADLPSIHTDPFTKREGKTLTWTNINMTLVSRFFINFMFSTVESVSASIV
jgi:hypothetical protein